MTEALRPSAATVAALNQLPEAEARQILRRCCGASRWVDGMLRARPFASPAALLSRADEVWSVLQERDYLEAFSHHPEIGADLDELRKRFAGTASLSESEQAGAAGASEATLLALRSQNRAYRERFGYSFIVCATGKTADEMLWLLEQRLGSQPDAELAIAAAEQAKITRLRLEKLSTMSGITTHVLDTSLGKPAATLEVSLSVQDGAGWRELGRGITNADGRVRRFSPDTPFTLGTYQLTFLTAAYFSASSRTSFFERVTLEFRVTDESQHYHVPLLLTPFGYTTYRGS